MLAIAGMEGGGVVLTLSAALNQFALQSPSSSKSGETKHSVVISVSKYFI